MDKSLLVCGGGIGGLAAALATARAGWGVTLLEQSPVFAEVGAGIQLGPNAVRVLQGLGLEPGLRAVAAQPPQLEVRNAVGAALLGVLPLGARAEQRYGAPYLTVARSDLQTLLLDAVRAQGGVGLHLNTQVFGITQGAQQVQLQTLATEPNGHTPGSQSNANSPQGQRFEAPLLVGADGLWSRVRKQVVVPDVAPRVTGHLAYRAMLAQSDLPAALRSQVVTAWLGPDFHAVQYPVRGGAWLNVVCIVQDPRPSPAQGQIQDDLQSWDHSAHAKDLRRHMQKAGGALRELIHAIDNWRLWPLSDRAPMASAAEQAKGRIALLGDAAHPMRPYLAQGAGMALEDAAALAECISATPPEQVPEALGRYAALRWQRNARVQARAIRNGQIYHMQGLQGLGRDTALRLFGARLMDLPWLYNGP